jgi:hypothetical protein
LRLLSAHGGFGWGEIGDEEYITLVSQTMTDLVAELLGLDTPVEHVY